MSHNPKYHVKYLKRNKVKLSDIRELWKKKKYSEENIMSIYIDIILQLSILAVSVHQVSQKRKCYQSRRTYCLFSLCHIVQFVNTGFLGIVSVNLRDLCQILFHVKFVSRKGKFTWIANKLTSIGSFNIWLLKLLAWIRFTFASHSTKWEQLLMNNS